jgi:hypothetical protein
MNERIKELYDTALVAAGKEKQFETTHLHVAEKFAELIVQECAGMVADAVDHREPASTYVGKIKQHFGVEE